MSKRTRYFKTVFKLTVLSEHGPVSEACSLEQIAREITDGGWSGELEPELIEELSARQVADELVMQGSSPDFFDIDFSGLTRKDHKKYPRKDWQYEVANGDTTLGYVDWVWSRIDMAETE